MKMSMRRVGMLLAAMLPLLATAASHDLATFVVEYDLDRDGKVSKEEFQKERERRFASTDTDRDGGISREEYLAEFRVRLAFSKPDPKDFDKQMEQATVRFNVLDTDKDGRISAAEFHSSGWAMFAEHDYNRDGAVSSADKH